MPEPSGLFRREALEHRADAHLRAEPLRLGSRWGRRAPLGLLGLFAAATVAGLVVHVDERASGPSLVGADGTAVQGVLPASARDRLIATGRVDLDLPGGRRVTLRIDPGGVGTVDAGDAARRFGRGEVAGLLATSTSLIGVEGRLGVPVAPAERGRARASVRLGSQALLPMLLSGLLDRGAGT
ncbi:MAG TPA: hypothetical protein VH134_18605 [Candidatus Dormibacteraeota bacterium]|nr:hypothetical protein [Candidatus Dormibacteraeota bacterium]